VSEHIEDPLTREASSWWPPIHRAVETGLAKHKKNSLLAAKTVIPAKARRQLKELKDAGMIPGMKRVKIDSPWHFRHAYDRLISHGGRPDASREEQTPIKELLAEERGAASVIGKAILAAVVDDKPELSAAVRFGSRKGILTEKETKRLAELEQRPRGWLSPRLLAVTHPEYEKLKAEQLKREQLKRDGQLKADRPKMLEGVEVIEIPEDEEDERLHLKRKLDEARVTEICFTPDFDTGKMTAMLCGPVPDDLLRKECSRSGRNLWLESKGGPPVSGKPREEVIVTALARVVEHNSSVKLPENYKTGITWKDFCKLVPERLVLARKVVDSIEANQSPIQCWVDNEAVKVGRDKIYRNASPDAFRVIYECLRLANKHQRPPTRGELSKALKWPAGAIKEFTALLREVGLAWLKEDHAAKGKRSR
jgi:hypothetical protein